MCAYKAEQTYKQLAPTDPAVAVHVNGTECALCFAQGVTIQQFLHQARASHVLESHPCHTGFSAPRRGWAWAGTTATAVAVAVTTPASGRRPRALQHPDVASVDSTQGYLAGREVRVDAPPTRPRRRFGLVLMMMMVVVVMMMVLLVSIGVVFSRQRVAPHMSSGCRMVMRRTGSLEGGLHFRGVRAPHSCLDFSPGDIVVVVAVQGVD